MTTLLSVDFRSEVATVCQCSLNRAPFSSMLNELSLSVQLPSKFPIILGESASGNMFNIDGMLVTINITMNNVSNNRVNGLFTCALYIYFCSCRPDRHYLDILSTIYIYIYNIWICISSTVWMHFPCSNITHWTARQKRQWNPHAIKGSLTMSHHSPGISNSAEWQTSHNCQYNHYYFYYDQYYILILSIIGILTKILPSTSMQDDTTSSRPNGGPQRGGTLTSDFHS